MRAALACLVALLVPADDPPRPDRTLRADAKGDGFGRALAAVGDLDDDELPELAVGAPNVGSGEPGSVSVHGGKLGRELWSISGSAPDDEFGCAIAGGFEFDRDGVPDFAVGARTLDAGDLRHAGAVVLVSGRTRQPWRTLVGKDEAGHFGTTVENVGDVDGDGTDDLAVGAPGARAASGRVVVYSGRTLGVLHELVGSRDGEEYGTAIARIGDVDGDGGSDFAVGGPGATFRGKDEGVVRLVSGKRGRSLRTLTGHAPHDRLGERIAGIGDVDGDGVPDLAVGAPSVTIDDMPDAGVLRIYSGKLGKLIQAWPGERPGEHVGERFGSGFDWDGDGANDLWVGVVRSEQVRTGRGEEENRGAEVRVVSAVDGRLLARLPGPRHFSHFGAAAAVWPTTTRAGDDAAWLAVGAPGRREAAPLPEDPKAVRGEVLAWEVTAVDVATASAAPPPTTEDADSGDTDSDDTDSDETVENDG